MRTIATLCCCVLAFACEGEPDQLVTSPEELQSRPIRGELDQLVTWAELLPNPPTSGAPAPADYNGDGVVDMGVQGANNWYIDIGICAAATGSADPLPRPTGETDCGLNDEAQGGLDDDQDGFFNDGCPVAGPAAETSCDNMYDDDGDGLVNDGCPFCMGQDRYGGPWDFAYAGYGSTDATPKPADYGLSTGAVDPQRRADLSIKTTGGMWAIDYADNGFGSWDVVLYGYGNASSIPVPADYDGDGRTDLSVRTSGGSWLIDYASNGFGSWDPPNRGCATWPNFSSQCTQLPAIYGGSTTVPAPADYNGDGRADLAYKSSTGQWKIDYSNTANTGFGSFNAPGGVQLTGYGDASYSPVPFNYDPWRDNKADIAVKGQNGQWYVDYADGGFGQWNIPCAGPTTACSSFPMTGYGGTGSIAIPGDYDGDALVDLTVKDSSGVWYIDRGYNGWFGWDYWPGTSTIQINNPARVNYDATRPHIISTKVYNEGGFEVSQLVAGVRYTADVIIAPGTTTDETKRQGFVEVRNDLVPASLKIANRTGSTYVADFANDSQGNPISPAHRRFSLVCTVPGTFPLAFQIRNRPPFFYEPTPEVFNRDSGIAITCLGPGPGVSGTVRSRVRDPITGVFRGGGVIPGATITVEAGATGIGPTTADSLGFWTLPLPPGGPYRLRISAPNKSDAKIVNLVVPASGTRVDVALEQAFDLLAIAGINYTMYIDYSRGRTIFHTVKLNRLSSAVSVGHAITGLSSPGPESDCGDDELDPDLDDVPKDGFANDGCPAVGAPETYIACSGDGDEDEDGFINDGCPVCTGPEFALLKDVGAADPFTGVLINSHWWNLCNADTQGFSYSATQTLSAEVWCDDGYSTQTNCSSASSTRYLDENGNDLYPGGSGPMFTAVGTATQQVFGIVEATHNFLDPTSTTWNQVGSPPRPIWDVSPRNGISDVSYALQIPNPPLLRNGQVIRGGDFRLTSGPHYDHTFARTTLGLATDGNLYIVIADGENIQGGHGATANQTAKFYRDVLGATTAMGLDSALSTQLLLKTGSGLYRVNTVTGEDNTIQLDPHTQVLGVDDPGLSWGKVGYYLKARL